jgi:hypothetical protein
MGCPPEARRDRHRGRPWRYVVQAPRAYAKAGLPSAAVSAHM